MTGLLPPEETARLRRLFQLLRTEHRTKYKVLAPKLGVDVDVIYSITSGRSCGTDDLLKSVESYIASQEIRFSDDEDKYEQFGLDYVLDALGIDAEIIAESASRAAGRYLLFSYLANQRIAVTWVELFGISQQLTVPVFKARRVGTDGRDIIYKGFYYEYLSSLFIFGHIEETPLARSLVLVPIAGPRKRDRQGMLLGASYPEHAFAGPCYFWALPEPAKRTDFDGLLGDHEGEAIPAEYAQAVESIRSRAATASSMPRTG